MGWHLNDEQLKESTLDTTAIFKGKMIDLYTLTVALPNGKTSTREVVRHPGAVAVVAEPQPGQILFVRQFRKAPEQILWELPAGKLELNELPEVCAKRELEEETGYKAQSVALIYDFFTSPGFADERISLYFASELQLGEQNPDEDEFVHVYAFSKTEILDMLGTGQIRDAKTLVGLLWWLQQGQR